MSRVLLRRAGIALLYAIPAGFFVWLYWFALRAWFQQDDFAWLSIRSEVHSWPDLLRALFQPRAQGTIRPWSERLFFLVLFDRFGLDHRPFHLAVALTQCANLLLVQSITYRIARSRWAALAAACVWLVNAGLATPLSWLSTFNQILCAFFLLLAFRLLLLFIDTGRMRWWWVQFLVFILGFGALEINIVYPALAAAWCALAARPHLRRTVWLFVVSVVYAAVHFHFAPKPAEGVYARHWDLSVIPTYFSYWRAALAAEPIAARAEWPAWAWNASALLLAAAGLAALVWLWRRGDRLAHFGFLWFTLALAPVLPLRDHFSLYYLGIPSIGLAWIFAAPLSRAARANRWTVALCAACVAFHFYLAIPFNRATTVWHFERGLRIRSLVEGLERAHQLHPGRLIALAGIDSELFWAGYFDRPYSLYGLSETCLVPGSDQSIDAHPELGDVAPYLCASPVLADTSRQQRLVVYAFEGARLRNITRKYVRQMSSRWNSAWPEFIDAGQPAYARFLGPGWYDIQGNFRWMGKRAELTLSASAQPDSVLSVTGYCPTEHLQTPLPLAITVNGAPIGRVEITRANNSFAFQFPLPPAALQAPSLKVVLEAGRTVTPPNDGRALGLVFGKIGVTSAASPRR